MGNLSCIPKTGGENLSDFLRRKFRNDRRNVDELIMEALKEEAKVVRKIQRTFDCPTSVPAEDRGSPTTDGHDTAPKSAPVHVQRARGGVAFVCDFEDDYRARRKKPELRSQRNVEKPAPRGFNGIDARRTKPDFSSPANESKSPPTERHTQTPESAPVQVQKKKGGVAFICEFEDEPWAKRKKPKLRSQIDSVDLVPRACNDVAARGTQPGSSPPPKAWASPATDGHTHTPESAPVHVQQTKGGVAFVCEFEDEPWAKRKKPKLRSQIESVGPVPLLQPEVTAMSLTHALYDVNGHGTGPSSSRSLIESMDKQSPLPELAGPNNGRRYNRAQRRPSEPKQLPSSRLEMLELVERQTRQRELTRELMKSRFARSSMAAGDDQQITTTTTTTPRSPADLHQNLADKSQNPQRRASLAFVVDTGRERRARVTRENSSDSDFWSTSPEAGSVAFIRDTPREQQDQHAKPEAENVNTTATATRAFRKTDDVDGAQNVPMLPAMNARAKLQGKLMVGCRQDGSDTRRAAGHRRAVMKNDKPPMKSFVSKRRQVRQADDADTKRQGFIRQQGPDRRIVWPKHVTGHNKAQLAYYVEQFQRTELYRQRCNKKHRGLACWKNGLTEFQLWVVEHEGTNEMVSILDPLAGLARDVTAQPKVDCWRGRTPPPQ